MQTFSSPLDNIKVASPCSADWNAMIGDDRTRFCGSCKLNVYNLSGMSRDEAERLIINNEGRLCVRFFRRADGSVLTKDCPVGWAAFKRRVSKTATAFASLIFGIVSGFGLHAFFSRTEETIMGKFSVSHSNTTLMGDLNVDDKDFSPTTGIAVVPSRVDEKNFSVGRIATSSDGSEAGGLRPIYLEK